MRLSLIPWNVDTETAYHFRNNAQKRMVCLGSYAEDLLGKRGTADVLTAIRNADDVAFLPDLMFDKPEEIFHILELCKDKNAVHVSRELYPYVKDKHHNIRMLKKEMKDWHSNNWEKTILEMPVPVFAVAGAGENTDKFKTQLMIKEVLSEKGYKGLVVSSNELAAVFGDYTLPGFLFQNDLTFKDKVFMLNEYCWKLCDLEHPDVFVIGIPGGCLPLMKKEYNCFGEMAYLIGNAIPVDYCIYNVYLAEQIDLEGVFELQRFLEYRFNLPLDAIGYTKWRAENFSSIDEYEYLCDDGFKYNLNIKAEGIPFLIETEEKLFKKWFGEFLDRATEGIESL